MNFRTTEIEGVIIIEPKVLRDHRGYFFRSYSQPDFEKRIRKIDFVHENVSKSMHGVLRGLHFQKMPYTESKLVRVSMGKVLDIAVDLRKNSPTFGQHVAVELSEDNKKQLFIPRGFAHGFVVLSDVAVFQYKCDNVYASQAEGSVRWNDPELNIDWRLPEDQIILSEKDKMSPFLKDLDYVFDEGNL